MFDFFWKRNKPVYAFTQAEYDEKVDLIKQDRAIIARQARDIAQLTEQLDTSNLVKLQFQLDEANETIEVWKDRAQHWKAEYEALQQQQITLTKPKGKPRVTGAKP
jgi:DNA repair exonuclease SbcCD ATPase subunit